MLWMPDLTTGVASEVLTSASSSNSSGCEILQDVARWVNVMKK